MTELGESSLTEDVVDDTYFSSYGDLSVHTLMLKDKPRMDAYMKGLLHNKEKISGKVVMDVGAGTGVLSMLCAKLCQPMHIYAVEATASTAHLMRSLVESNGLAHLITVIESPVEQVQLAEKVDVILSEWMGFYLFHESMLDSVLRARDRFLRPGGLLLPSQCCLWVAGVQQNEFKRDNIDFWGNYMGLLDFSTVGTMELAAVMSSPQVKQLEQNQLLTSAKMFGDRVFDLNTLQEAELLCLQAQMSLPVVREGVLAGVAVWFDVAFGDFDSADCPRLRTGPSDEDTHWHQTSIFLGCFAPVVEGISIDCSITLQKLPTDRQYTIIVET